MLFLSALTECMDPLIGMNMNGLASQLLVNTIPQEASNCISIQQTSALMNHGLELISVPATENFASGSSGPAMPPTSLCGGCGNQITDKTFLLVGEKSWHDSCVRCAVCQRTLDGQPSCYCKDGLLYCKQDYMIKFWKRCERCGSVIDPGDLVMTSRDRIFHMNCFSCMVCAHQLKQGETYVVGENGSLFCQAHYEPFITLRSAELTSTNSCDNNVLQLLPPTNSMLDEAMLNAAAQSCSTGPNLCPTRRHTKRHHHQHHGSGDDSVHGDFMGDDDGLNGGNSKAKRMRTSFKHHQLRTMKTYFNLNHNPDAKDLKQLAQKTGLTKRVLQVWFQNARAKYRRSMQGNREGSTLSPNGNSNFGMSSGNVLSELNGTNSSMSTRTSSSPSSIFESGSFAGSISPEAISDDSCTKGNLMEFDQ
uniref:LIM/homeobox protein Lhx9 n=1 Tax=Acrobeloides nanus TaxID=290746 RepID=A0A914E7A2_9BILA